MRDTGIPFLEDRIKTTPCQIKDPEDYLGLRSGLRVGPIHESLPDAHSTEGTGHTTRNGPVNFRLLCKTSEDKFYMIFYSWKSPSFDVVQPHFIQAPQWMCVQWDVHVSPHPRSSWVGVGGGPSEPSTRP